MKKAKSVKAGKDNKTSRASKGSKKLKSQKSVVSHPETIIEFVWSEEVAKAWSRMKKQLQNPFIGEVPPTAGVINRQEDIWISQLALMYSSIIQDRKYQKLLKEKQDYDPYSLRYVIRNFCSPAFFEKRDKTKKVELEKEEIKEEISGDLKKDVKASSKEVDKHKDEAVKKKKIKTKDRGKVEIKETKPIAKSEEPFKPWRVCIPYPNMFPGLHLTPSAMSLISEPVEDVSKQKEEVPEAADKKDKKDKKPKKGKEEKKPKNRKKK